MLFSFSTTTYTEDTLELLLILTHSQYIYDKNKKNAHLNTHLIWSLTTCIMYMLMGTSNYPGPLSGFIFGETDTFSTPQDYKTENLRSDAFSAPQNTDTFHISSHKAATASL